jgi:hypothetical protein
METNPCSALVKRPEEVASDSGKAKKARKARDIPSNRNSGPDRSPDDGG